LGDCAIVAVLTSAAIATAEASRIIMLNSVARLGIEPVLIGKRKAPAYVPSSTEIRVTAEGMDNGSLKEFVYPKRWWRTLKEQFLNGRSVLTVQSLPSKTN
jgi:hypothetical protein